MHDESSSARLMPIYQLPIRMGFYLERARVTCFCWPDKPYRGIDRFPFLPSFEEQDEWMATGREKLSDLWDRYWDAKEDGETQASLELALRLQREFFAENIELEVVYSEIVMIPENLERYPQGEYWAERFASILPIFEQTHERLKQRPDNLRFLGFDVTTLHSIFHSVIYQPGLHETCPDLPNYLNDAGLFADLDTASRFLNAANEMDYAPFLVVSVWEV